MPLSTDQLTDMRGDLRIGADPAVFTDAQLQRFYTRAGEDYDKAMVYALRQMWADSAKIVDYTIGETIVKRSDIRKGIAELLKHWERQAGMTGGRLQTGTMSLGLDEPEDSSEWA